jgi:microcystin-dependent protein
MPESLANEFISDFYTSLLHLSGVKLENKLNRVFDGAGNSTGLALSGDRVIINNYVYPVGYASPVEWLDAFWPVGSIKLTFNDQNPGDYLLPPRSILDGQDPNNFPGIQGTKWERVGEGRFLVGVGEDEINGALRDFCPGGKEEEAAGLREGSGDVAGEYEVELRLEHIPAHNHTTNTGAQTVQVRSQVGGQTLFEGTPPGTTNSTQSFDQQQRARNALLVNAINFDGDRTIGSTGLSEVIFTDFDAGPGMIGSIMYGLDLGFTRDTSRDYSPGERSKFESVEGYKAAGGFLYQDNDANWPNFKEMIGIWNGETRFVADLSSQGQRRGVNPEFGAVAESANPYTIAKSFGAVDYTDAVAGEFLAQHNKTQTTTADREVLDVVEGLAQNRATNFVGDNEPHNNIPPSYGIYIWKRVE